jgi:V8-like Glu-specific endopeptidase
MGVWVSRRTGFRAGAAALGVLAAIGVLVVVAAVTIGVAEAGGTAQPAGASVVDAVVTGPATAVTDQLSGAAQHQALVHWTRQRMQGATVATLPRSPILTAPPAVARTPTQPGRDQGGSEITAPRGTPKAVPFSGSPTTGVLFYTTGGKGHFCTASVVVSTADDLALTAAHCVYSAGFASNIEYVPEYHNGKQPYGVWPVKTITVASGWKLSRNPDLDFAFLTLASVGGRQIQARTGGLTIGFTRWNSEKIEAIGHNDTGAAPVRCATKSFRFRTGQMEFYCHGFWTGTSGGPWIIGYDARNGTGTVFGVIGGYELGGDYEWASYSAYFGSATRILYQQVERRATTPTPTPTPTRSPTATPTPTVSVA